MKQIIQDHADKYLVHRGRVEVKDCKQEANGLYSASD